MIGRCQLADASTPTDSGVDGGVLADAGDPQDLGPDDGGSADDMGSEDEDLGPPDLGPPDLGPPDLGPPDMGSGRSPVGALVINEVDYDESGTDAREYIELLNTSGSAISLDGVRLFLINGSTSSEYQMVDFSGTLSAGGRLVVAGDTASGGLLTDAELSPAEVIVRTAGVGTNVIQNGAPDGVLVVHAPSSTLIDSLAYEGTMSDVTIGGFAYPIGSGTAPAGVDTGAPSLCRLPDGADTGDDSADFALCSLTPGATNAAL